ncbi:MAG: tetratricopeptide repeat protein [Candidatus Hydrogenedentota bacterium]
MRNRSISLFVIIIIVSTTLFSQNLPTINDGLKSFYEGKYKDALITFRTLSQDSSFKDRDLALYYAGISCERLNQPEDALVYYQTIIERYKDSSMLEYANIRINELKSQKIKPSQISKKEKIKKTDKDKTTKPKPEIKKADLEKLKQGDLSIKVKSGESLSSIATIYYGDASYYKRIAEYNGIKPPYFIYVGQTLVLPGLSKIGEKIPDFKQGREIALQREKDAVIVKFPQKIKEEEIPTIEKETEVRKEQPLPEVPPVVLKETEPLKITINISQQQEIWDKAVIEFKKEQYLNSLKILKEIIDNYSESNYAIRSRYFRGFIYYTLGNLIQAIPEYISVAKISMDDPIADDALYSAAELYYFVLKDYDKALELYNILDKMDQEPILENGFPLKPLIKRRIEEAKQIKQIGIEVSELKQQPVITLPPPLFKTEEPKELKPEIVVEKETKPVIVVEKDEVKTKKEELEKLIVEAEETLKKQIQKPDTVIQLPPKKVKKKKVKKIKDTKVVKKPVFTPKPKTYGPVEKYSDIVMFDGMITDESEFKTTIIKKEQESIAITTPTVSMKEKYDKEIEPELIVIQEKAREEKKEFAPSKYQSSLHLRLARAYREQGMIQEAIREYEEALKYDADNPVTYNNLAYMYVESGQNLQRAKDLIQKGLSLNPAYRGYYLDTLGLIYFKEGNKEQAILNFKKSIEEKETPQRYLHLGMVYSDLGLREEAKGAFARAYELSGGQGIVAEKAKEYLINIK